MGYHEILPSPRLAPYVQLVWCLELDDPTEFGPPERIAPDGILELVVHYRQPFVLRYGDGAFRAQPRSSVVSQTRRSIEIEPTGRTGLISVRFRPWGAHRFLRCPVRELADRQVAAEDVWGTAVHDLEERLQGTAGVRNRVAEVEAFLLERLRLDGTPDVEPLVRTVWRHRGRVGMAQLAREVGSSERTLQRRFTAALGMTPKGYARLTRFLHACAVLRRGADGGLAHVGQECGYYDQAHFIADFRAFAGMTPGQFAAAAGMSFLELE